MPFQRTSVFGATLAFAAVVCGQAADDSKGRAGPAFEFQRVWNAGPTKFDDLAGRVVLLKFCATWCRPCRASVPRSNDLHAKYRDQGLDVVAVVDGTEAEIEGVFVDQLGTKHPIVRAGKAAQTAYSVRGFPQFVLLDADGRIVVTTMGREPAAEVIEKALVQAAAPPRLSDDPRYDALRALWQKREFAAVQAYLDKNLAAPRLDAAMREVFTEQLEQLKIRHDAALARIVLLANDPDAAVAERSLQRIETEWRGTKLGALAGKELAAARELRRLLAEPEPADEAQRAARVAALEALATTYSGTQAASRAKEHAAAIGRR